MAYRWEVLHRIQQSGVVGIVRSDSAQAAAQAAQDCLDGGLPVVEVTLTSPDALSVLADLSARYPSATLGAGTVLDEAAVSAAVRAGAAFIVSPTLDRRVMEAAHRLGAAVIPGVATPGEALNALTWGADAVKLFPASRWSPASLADVRAALPQAPFIPTGGIGVDQAGEWIRAGAVAVGLGSGLTRGTSEAVRARCAALADAVRMARQPEVA